MTDETEDGSTFTDEQGRRYILGADGETRYYEEPGAPSNGPFIDEEGEYFLTNPDENGVRERYVPPKVEAPLFYTCEHGSSNEPDLCILVIHPDAKPMPDDWYLDPIAPYAYAAPHVLAKVVAAQAGVMLDSVTVR